MARSPGVRLQGSVDVRPLLDPKLPALDGPRAPTPGTTPPPVASPEPPAVGLAPRPQARALDRGGVDVVWRGVVGLAERAAEKGPAPAMAALRQLHKQLDQLSPRDVAALPMATVLALLTPLSCAVDQARAGEGRVGVEAARLAPELSATLARLGLPAAVDGPAGAAVRAAQTPATRALLAEALTNHPDPTRALTTLGRAPGLPAMLERAAAMYPARTPEARAALRGALDQDLAVGGVGAALEARMQGLGLSRADADAFLGALAEVRAGFATGAQAGDDMQRVNWMHTRIEILHTLEAVSALGLRGDGEGRTALLASLYGSLVSDAFKDKSTFSLLWHNRPAAELIAPLVVGRAVDTASPAGAQLLDWTRHVAHEHQVTPPMFMAGPMKGTLTAHVAQRGARPTDEAAIAEIFGAVSKPMAAPAAGNELVFSPAARALLEEVGLSGWAVPSASPWRAASMAAIAGDVWQYVSPEGVIKIAVDLRDPGSPAGPFMRDPVLSLDWLARARPEAAEAARGAGQGGAVESSVGFSFGQGMSVLEDPALVKHMQGQQQAMRTLLAERVLPEVETRLRRALGVPSGAPTPAIPYWNAPVDTSAPLSPEARASADRVKATFRDVMAELGGVPLDPFGASTAPARGGAR